MFINKCWRINLAFYWIWTMFIEHVNIKIDGATVVCLGLSNRMQDSYCSIVNCGFENSITSNCSDLNIQSYMHTNTKMLHSWQCDFNKIVRSFYWCIRFQQQRCRHLFHLKFCISHRNIFIKCLCLFIFWGIRHGSE